MSEKIKWLKCSKLSLEDRKELYEKRDKQGTYPKTHILVKKDYTIDIGCLTKTDFCFDKKDFKKIKFRFFNSDYDKLKPTHYALVEFEDA